MDQAASANQSILRNFGKRVRSQIWIAVSAYVLVAIVKKRLHLSASLYEILQILSLTMFEKIPLDQLLAQTMTDEIQHVSDNQLILFT
jgi:hypothetical protein